MKTFKEVREATADDLKSVINLLTAAEQNIRDGDLEALDNIIDKWGLWGQMLAIRHTSRVDDYRAKQEASAPSHLSQISGADQ